jgi:hypothetical protein
LLALQRTNQDQFTHFEHILARMKEAFLEFEHTQVRHRQESRRLNNEDARLFIASSRSWLSLLDVAWNSPKGDWRRPLAWYLLRLKTGYWVALIALILVLQAPF